MRLIKLIPILFLVSCIKPVQPGHGGTASYYVDSIVKKASTPSHRIENWDITDAQIFKFSVCLKDNVKQRGVLVHRFNITGPDHPVTDPLVPVTDPGGCLNWSETIAFDPLAKPCYITIERTLHPDGIQRGEVTVKLGINPWTGVTDSNEAVADFSIAKDKVARLCEEDVTHALQTKTSVKMLIENLGYQFTDRQDLSTEGHVEELRLNFKVSLKTKDMNDVESNPLSLTKGSLLVTSTFYRIENGKRFKLNETPQPEIAVINDKVATVTFKKVKMIEEIKQTGRYEVVLEAKVNEASHPPKGIEQFVGVMLVGDGSNVRAGSATIVNSPEVAPEQYKALAQTSIANVNQAPFRIGDAASIHFQHIKNEDSFNRLVGLKLSLPIISAFDSSSLPDRYFLIYLVPRGANLQSITPVKRKTNNSGMLYWPDAVLNYDIYKSMHKIAYDIVVEYLPSENAAADLKHARQTLPICINPWDELSGDFAGTAEFQADATCRDVKGATPFVSDIAKVPTLFINSVGWERTDISYRVNQTLGLSIKHDWTMSLKASIKRYDGDAGQNGSSEALRPGIWALTTTLFHYDKSNKKIQGIAASSQKLVRYEQGLFTSQIRMKFNESNILDAMTLQKYLAVQITQVDPTSLETINGQVNLNSKSWRPMDSAHSDLKSEPVIVNFVGAKDTKDVVGEANATPQVKALYQELKNKSLLERHREFAVAKVERQVPSDTAWMKTAEDLKLKGVAITNDEDAQKVSPLFKRRPMTLALLKRTLSCLDKQGWAPKDHMNVCATDPEVMHAMQNLCGVFMDPKPPGILNISPINNLDLKFMNCGQNPTQGLHVEEKTVVYSVNSDHSKFVGGFATSMTVSNLFGNGSFNGSDYGSSDTSSFSASLATNGLTPAGGNFVNGGTYGVGLFGVTAGRSHASTVADFQREYADNQAYANNNVTLKIESADLNLEILRYRECYVLKSETSPDKQGLFICYPIEDKKPKVVVERYFDVYNTTTDGALTDQTDKINRFMLNFRGERDYYTFLGLLSHSLRPFYDKMHLPHDVSQSLQCSRDSMMKRLEGQPNMIDSVQSPVQSYSRIDGSTRTAALWNPIQFSDLKPNRNLNDPEPNVSIQDVPQGGDARGIWCPYTN